MDDSARMSEIIGKRIRDVRIARKMSQQELATKADISLPHVSDIELGKKSMKLVTFIRITRALNVSPEAILHENTAGIDQWLNNEFAQIVDDCTPSEVEVLKRFVIQLKETMRKPPQTGE